MIKFAATLIVAGLACSSVAAADLGIAPQEQHVEATALPAEHHVIEIVGAPYSGAFIINGTSFLAISAACLRWAAGEEVRLRAGDWHGRCVTATFYNVARRQSCQVSCGEQQIY